MNAANIQAQFEADVANRHAAGLPQKQAELAALAQLVRDARTGTVDEGAAYEIIVAVEVECGRSPEEAELHARAVLDGQSSQWAPRDFGYQKARQRRRAPQPHDAVLQADPFISESLSAWANHVLL